MAKNESGENDEQSSKSKVYGERTEFLPPWVQVGAFAIALEEELQREIVPGHALFGLPTRAIAQRTDCDDVLFEVLVPEHRYAVVHLSWRGQREEDARWPHTEFFLTFEDWIEKCM